MNTQEGKPLISSQEGFHASHFPWLETKKAKGTTATYGRRCSELSENLARVGCFVKTYLGFSNLPDEQFVRTWSVKDTLSPFLILKLRLSARHIDENGCSLWRTAVTSDANDRVMYVNSRGGPNLSGQVKLWSTPAANDAKNTTLPHSQRNRDTLPGNVIKHHGVKGRLNPAWAEQLMGFPVGWTECTN